MKATTLLFLLLAALATALHSAEEQSAPSSRMKEALRARLAEDARKAAPAPAKKDAATAKSPAPPATSAPAPGATPPTDSAATPAATTADAASSDPKAAAAKAPPTVLPQVEVKKGKYSERDRKLAWDLHNQEQAIEREKKNLVASETDLALNDVKIARPLAIFGGESAQFRQRVASERVELMEAERDIIEQIAIAQKPEEKALLQKQLDEIRALRRQLDKALR